MFGQWLTFDSDEVLIKIPFFLPFDHMLLLLLFGFLPNVFIQAVGGEGKKKKTVSK